MAMMPLPGSNDPRLPKNFRLDPPGYTRHTVEGTGGQMLGTGRPGGFDGRGFHGHDPRDGRKQTEGLLSAFFPGQQDALAQQLAAGFGGGLKKWNGILGQTYSDMKITPNPLDYPRGKPDDRSHDHDRDRHDGDHGKPDPSDPNDPGYNPFGHDGTAPWLGGMMQAANPQMFGAMQQPMIQGPAVASPMMQSGMQPQVSNGLSPQVMAMLRARFGGR